MTKNLTIHEVKLPGDTEEWTVPLDPSTFRTLAEQILPNIMGGDILVPIEEVLKGTFWASKDDPHLDIKSCPTSLLRSLSLLADSIQGMKLSHVTRVAAERGRHVLWTLPGAGELAEIHNQLIQRSLDEVNVLSWLEKASFDLGTNDTARLHGRIWEKDSEMIFKLAAVVGLRHRPSTVMVIALGGGILGSKKIPSEYNNQFAKLLGRFGDWISERLLFAKRLQSITPLKTPQNEKRLTLVDVFDGLDEY